MNILRTVTVSIGGLKEKIYFGIPDTEYELKQMFSLRYQEYSERGYIDEDNEEKDEYDVGHSVYFIVKWEDKIIGTIRLIQSDPLPTELDFEFRTPDVFIDIDKKRLSEFGRFVIVPLDKGRKKFLPRGLVMLVLFDVLLDYCDNHGIIGGYAFVKTSLYKKMQRLLVPVKKIYPYKQRYPSNGVLYKYFSQVENPVLPIFFEVKNFKKYMKNILSNRILFERKGIDLFMKNNLFVKILKVIRFI